MVCLVPPISAQLDWELESLDSLGSLLAWAHVRQTFSADLCAFCEIRLERLAFGRQAGVSLGCP